MALISVASKGVGADSIPAVIIPVMPIYHPPYAFLAVGASLDKEAVQKQAAENFKWGS